MSSIRTIGWVCTLCVAAGCVRSDGPAGKHAAPQMAQAPPMMAAGPQGAPVIPVERKIIYTSQIDVVVEDMATAQQRLMALIKSVSEQGGYLARQEVVGSAGSHRQASWTIRVPQSQYDSFVAEVEKLGELQRNSSNAQDVTEAYADLEARLRNKEASEQRLLSHLQKSAELKDTLELERELSRVRGEVEQLQGQMNVLKNKTDLATVSVSLFEREHYTPATTPSFTTQIGRTFDESLQALVNLGKGIVLIAVALSPWMVVAVVLSIPVFLVRRLIRV